jgi:DNA-binding CsgD family transcriptional regulator
MIAPCRAENPADVRCAFYRIGRIAPQGRRADTRVRSVRSAVVLSRRFTLFVLVLPAITVGMSVLDILREPVPLLWGEIAVDLTEKLVLVLAMAGVAWAVHGIHDLREGQTALNNNLARAAAQGDAWRELRQAEISALGRAIEDQFKAWHLTSAEIDIAGLMLKGASLKEIALARETSEATIRQQAQSIYRKSGLSGRAELSAYFLESLFETAEGARKRQAGLTLVRPAG